MLAFPVQARREQSPTAAEQKRQGRLRKPALYKTVTRDQTLEVEAGVQRLEIHFRLLNGGQILLGENIFADVAIGNLSQ